MRVAELTSLTGKLFGDKGYLGKKLAATLLRRGLALVTKVRKNMKSLSFALTDKILLNGRNRAETIIGNVKGGFRTQSAKVSLHLQCLPTSPRRTYRLSTQLNSSNQISLRLLHSNLIGVGIKTVLRHFATLHSGFPVEGQ